MTTEQRLTDLENKVEYILELLNVYEDRKGFLSQTKEDDEDDTN